jgi:Icc-related predicted phosphoesterase
MGDGPGDASAMRTIKGMMNDYRGVKNSNRMVTRTVPIYKTDAEGNYVMEKNSLGYDNYVEIGTKKSESVSTFCPEDSYEDHQAYIKGLTEAMASQPDMQFIVVGHHAPSKQSTHPRYAKEVIINTAYSSDLTEFILDHPQIVAFTHGHTHSPFCYKIGTTTIFCNPRGYDGYEQRAYDFKLLTFDIVNGEAIPNQDWPLE